ncbi:XRE family transcriptional regulator [Rhodocytophaga rosea]|uniref:XRE family transcriptional regulator n=1 Tax=Rhodocytophaga rosea TaxID=2704465 RepID=A0A6C0GCJ1_9BACT|nr:XRE family transcriptional regulator [Rhodocytophaga rosea]QHT65676.1 XRE family transcriptional regulator [Rhodocytophaga rosea]
MKIDMDRPKKTIAEAIEEKQLPGTAWKPTKELYKKIGINQKRFGLILKGKIRPYADEITTIAEYFKLDKSQLF